MPAIRDVKPVQYTPRGGGPTGINLRGVRRIRLYPRSGTSFQFDSFPSPDGSEFVSVLHSAVVHLDGSMDEGPAEFSADRVVAWTDRPINDLDDILLDPNGRFELYLEGDIVIRQGNRAAPETPRVISASSMYYDIPRRFGVMLNAEMLTHIDNTAGLSNYQGLLRLKARVLHQVNSEQFVAHGGAMTSSRMGVPTYWFQTETLDYIDKKRPVIDPITGMPVADGDGMLLESNRSATSRNNFVYLNGFPVFYWPVLSANLQKPSYYLDGFSIKNDSVFGTQVFTEWDLHQLFGWDNSEGNSDWTLSLDYLNDRGPAAGTALKYQLDQFWSHPSPSWGGLDAWGIDDRGFDDLGADRRMLVPERRSRGRVLWRHRQRMHENLQFTAELGLISDRNFLEQYYEREWDEFKDLTTGIELKQLLGSSSWSVTSDVQLNEFFTQTEWLPRLDHYGLGHSFLWDRLTWYEHSHVGYARLETATRPRDPVDAAKFNPLAWEMEREGIRAASRQELDLPLNLGPAKVVPYAIGEIAHWGQDLSGDDVTRAYGQVGVRTSLPMWRIDPAYHSDLFNVNGLAHKVTFTSDLSYADANRNLDRFPLYDSLDDDAIEHFRRRLVDDTFGGTPHVDNLVPIAFDARYFALRSGMQDWVTSPVTEIANDLARMRLGIQQRWQTKRGSPGRQRIVDWIELDMSGTYFPRPHRDNFGENVGLLDYDFRWHLGDRVTLLSDGFADVFGDGLRTVTIGGFLTRPGKSDAYLGLRSLQGPIDSNVVVTALNYRLSPKWITRSALTYDLGEVGSIGQSFTMTRIGESFLVTAQVLVDHSRDNVSVGFSVEPRFLVNSMRSNIGGIGVLPVGAYGVE